MTVFTRCCRVPSMPSILKLRGGAQRCLRSFRQNCIVPSQSRIASLTICRRILALRRGVGTAGWAESATLARILTYGEPQLEPARKASCFWPCRASELSRRGRPSHRHRPPLWPGRGRAHRARAWPALGQRRRAPLPSSASAGRAAARPHDRTRLGALDDAERLFSHVAAAPLRTDVLAGRPRRALEAAQPRIRPGAVAGRNDYLVENFTAIGRNPTDVELMMFAQANSEHCRHKIFNADLCHRRRGQGTKFAVRHDPRHPQAHPHGTLVAYSDNSSVIEGRRPGFIPDRQPSLRLHAEPTHILMKVETHNHPTAISPFPAHPPARAAKSATKAPPAAARAPKAGLTGFTVSNLNIPDLYPAVGSTRLQQALAHCLGPANHAGWPDWRRGVQ